MKFSCEKAILQTAIQDASRAVSAHATMEILKGLLFEAEDGHLSITGNNMQIGIQCSVEADIETAGKAVIDARIVGDIVRKLPDDIIKVSINENMIVNITCAMSEFNITALPAESFPSLPHVEADKSIALPQKLLRTMLSRTLFAVSENENKMIITGALFELEKNALTIVTLDGYRLALCREPVETGENNSFSFVTPGGALREVERMLEDTEDKQVSINLGSRHILFSADGKILIARLLEGEFFNYKKAIPAVRGHQYEMDTKTFLSGVERVSLLIDEKQKNPLRVRFGEEKVSLHCLTPLGRATDQFSCKGADEMEIGFNHRFLSDALKAVPDKEIRFESDGPFSPSLLLPLEGDSYLFMVVPVRLKEV